MRRIILSTCLTAAALFPIAAAASYTVYLQEGRDNAALRKHVTELLPKPAEGQAECRFVVLNDKPNSSEQAEAQADAMAAGVTHLPCLVLADAEGPFATLLLQGLKTQDIIKAEEQAKYADRQEKTAEREFKARLYLLFAACSQRDPGAEQLEELVQESRQLLSDERCTRELQQLIGLRCLYPLLMKQYAIGHTGAHTPATEAKLLEAIAALETARDIDPNSKLGKRAHDERHRLRMARREARKYE